MDIYHLILILIIIILIICNNVRLIRNHYYKLFFIFTRKIYYYYKKSTNKIKDYNKSIIPKKVKKPEEAKINDIYKTISIKKLRSVQKKLSWNYSIGVLNLNCNLNIGAIYRTGCLLGMKKYIIFGKKIYNPKSQVGLNFVDIDYIDTFKKIRNRYDKSTIEDFNIDIFIKYINKNNILPVIIEQGGTNILNYNFQDFEKSNKHILFIFGNETHGTPSILLKYAKLNNWPFLSIPQWGCAHSYNVSQSANIIMWKYYQDSRNKIYRLI